MAGKKNLNSAYEWSLMNLSVGGAIHGFGEIAKDAIKQELLQLVIEKEALKAVKWEELDTEQRKRVV